MDQGIYTAASGARAMEEKLAIISNNIANASTSGFKRDAMSFEQFMKGLDTESLYPGQYTRVPVDVLAGEQYIDMTGGALKKTENPLDLSIAGDGFFVVNTGGGPRYTRSGSFEISTEGLLMTHAGDYVQGEGGDIAVGFGDVVVSPDGTVSVDGETIDMIQVVDVDPEGLERTGGGLFNIKDGYFPEPLEGARVEQGSVEMSNVDPVKEMVDLISTQRAYESFQKVIKTFDDTYSLTIRNVGVLA